MEERSPSPDDGWNESGREEEREAEIAKVVAGIEAKTSVHVVWRDLLASECDGVPLVLVDGGVDEDDDAARLSVAIRGGTRVVALKPGKHAVGEVYTHDVGLQYPATLLEALREVAPAVVRGSPLVRRLPADPLAVVSARREGDDVVVSLAASPETAALHDADDGVVAAIAPSPDGSLRFSCPDPGLDPRVHRLVVSFAGAGSRPFALRRAYSIVDLVGTAHRRVFSPRLAEAGAMFAPRVLFLNTKTGAPVAGWRERVSLRRADVVLCEASGASDEAGSLDAVLAVPADAPTGPADLVVGDDRFPIEISSGLRLSVVTERPLYRPSDEVYVRLMAHRASDGRPVPDADVALKLGSVEKRVKTSAFGIASAKFRLVDERPGSTIVEAKCGGAAAHATFRVGAFETPTFVVEFVPPSLALRSGETAPLKVRARYTNGGPVVGAEATFDAATGLDIAARRGTTDADGVLSWAITVEQDARRRALDASVWVKDADGRTAKAMLPVTVVGLDDAAAVSLVPLEEPVVGMPCRCALRCPPGTSARVAPSGDRAVAVALDEKGLGVVTITPAAVDGRVDVRLGGGVTVPLTLEAALRDEKRPLLLPDRRTWRVGETFAATVLGPDGPAYVDLARDGTTLLGRSVLVANGRARVEIPLAAGLAGVLEARAWRPDGLEPIGASVPVLVARGRSLRVAARVDRDGLRPGDVAAVDVDVADRDGRPTAGVLGYWGVDAALLAIEPWRDGGEEVFDVMPAARADDLRALALDVEGRRETDFASARAALGAPRQIHPDTFPVRHRSDLGAESAVAEREHTRLDARVARSQKALLEAFARVPLEALRTASSLPEMLRWIVDRGDLDAADLLDPWGTPMAFAGARDPGWHRARESESEWRYWIEHGYRCRSAGPDLVWGSADDLGAIWSPLSASEVGGRLGRFLVFLEGEEVLAAETPFEGPANNGLIGIGGGAGGAFKGRGGHRNLRAGGGGRKSEYESVHVRRDFSPTLCFVPEAIVGPDGKAHLEIPLKDAITTWRMRFVASAADGATGTGEGAIHVTQPLHVEPWIAPHLTVGDALEVPVAVRNETDAQVDVTVSLSTSREVEVVGAKSAHVEVGARGTGAVTFAIRAVAPGAARVRVDAPTAAAEDAVERIVTVRRLARAVVATQSGTISSDRPWSPAMAADAPTLPTDERVSLFPSPLADVLGGFEGLIACPHG